MPVIYSKSSFDRFGDDLCEVIVGQFSMADKFRFECLSKQWKRCIYQKQNELIIDYKLVNQLKRTNLLGEKYIDLDLMETVMKKCPFITRLFVETVRDHSHDNYRQLIQLIINHCKYLEEIDMYFNETDGQLFDTFFSKFGSKIKRIGFNNNSVLSKRHLILCSNLRQINVKRLSNESNLKTFFFEDNEISLKKLRKFEFKYSFQESEGFQQFVKKCKNSLKVIDIQIVNFDETSVNILLNGINELKELKVLRLDFYAIPLKHSIGSLIKQIGDNCPQLECFQLKISAYDLSISLDIFKQIRYMSQLKRFEFKFYSSTKVLMDCGQLTSETIRDCHQLTHLVINGSKIYDSFFTNIGHNLPKLQFLKVSNTKISEKSFRELSDLPDLRSLDLYLLQKFSVEAINSMIEKSKRLRLMVLSGYGFHLALDHITIERIKSKSMSINNLIDKKSIPNDVKQLIVR